MFPAPCDYYRADTIDGAIQLLSTHADRDPQLLAGGQGLVQDMKLGDAAPAVLVDVGGIDSLAGIDRTDDGVEIGALTTHSQLATLEAGALADAAAHVADRQVRNRATLGGNLAEADPAADLPAAVLAAGGTLVASGPDGERTIDADGFFEGPGTTALRDDEILTRVTVHPGDGGAYARKTHPASGYATVGVAACVDVADDTVSDCGVGVTGATDCPLRLPSVEAAVSETALADVDVDGAAARAAEDLDTDRLRDDPAVSGEYRADLVPAYTRTAIRTALERARGAGA